MQIIWALHVTALEKKAINGVKKRDFSCCVSCKFGMSKCPFKVCLLLSLATIVCKCFAIMLLVFSVCLTLCEKQADIYCF